LDLTLIDLDGNVLASSAEENGAESIVFSFSALVPTVRIEVSGYRDVSSAYYLGVIARCSSDRDCPEGQECSRELGVCEVQEPVDCGLDEYEPNNREDTATQLRDLPVNTEASVCGKDVDWFELSVNRGDIIDILVNFPGGVDLDLEVLNATDGSQVAQAVGDARSNPERLALSHLEEGSYLLAVRRYVGDDEMDGDITYQLEVVGRSGGCTSSAECLASGQPICEEGICVAAPPSAPLGAVCGRDEDCAEGADLCYEGGAGGEDNLCTVLCESDGGCDDLGEGAYCIPISWQEGVCVPACTLDTDCGSFYVCGEGRCVVDSACRIDSDCGDERICRTAQNGERYCARPTIEESCGLDEDFEPNDRFSNAVALPVGQRVQDLRICNADNDYFSFEVPPSMTPWTLTLDATFRSGTDIDIYVYDALGNLLGESTSPDQTTEAVNVALLAEGTVFLRVDQYDSDQLSDTVYSVLATLEESASRCTIAGEECGGIEPLRSICDEATGACSSLEGGGAVELGGSCDSEDDCVNTADLCWRYGMGSEPICTLL
jgi:hypothetical protein